MAPDSSPGLAPPNADSPSPSTHDRTSDSADSRKRRVSSDVLSESFECKRFCSFHLPAEPISSSEWTHTSSSLKHARTETEGEVDSYNRLNDGATFSVGILGSESHHSSRSKKVKRAIHKSSNSGRQSTEIYGTGLVDTKESSVIVNDAPTSTANDKKIVRRWKSNATSTLVSSLSHESVRSSSSSPSNPRDQSEERGIKKSKIAFPTEDKVSDVLHSETSLQRAFKVGGMSIKEGTGTSLSSHSFPESNGCCVDEKETSGVRNSRHRVSNFCDPGLDSRDVKGKKKVNANECNTKHIMGGGNDEDGSSSVIEEEEEEENASFILSSGRAKKLSGLNKTLTIDDEFEQYFNRLLL